MRAFLPIGILGLSLGWAAAAADERWTGGAEPVESTPPYALDYALARPIFGQHYTCSEHQEGLRWRLGDAFAADCKIEGFELVDGRLFARPYRTDGTANEDWYGWRQEVLSPCDGEVVRVGVNPITNEPGFAGDERATFAVVKRQDGVHFVLAHLDDLAVEVGDRVSAGQKIAVVGNNGHGRVPHVHIGAWHGETPLQIRFDLRAHPEE